MHELNQHMVKFKGQRRCPIISLFLASSGFKHNDIFLGALEQTYGAIPNIILLYYRDLRKYQQTEMTVINEMSLNWLQNTKMAIIGHPELRLYIKTLFKLTE